MNRKDEFGGLPEASPASGGQDSTAARLWERIVELGFGDLVLRVGTNILSLLFFLIVVWVMSRFFVHAPTRLPQVMAFAPGSPTQTPEFLPTLSNIRAVSPPELGISRQVTLHTDLPSQPRFEIVQYTVRPGDTVFGIAAQFSLQPQTILWGNFAVLADDPEQLMPGQVLNILPLDGVLYQWRTGDGLNGVAKFFGVSADDIIDWPGNHLNRASLGDLASPNIPDKTLLVIPGGTREFTSWSAPRVVRTDPAAAKGLGPGACTKAVSGAVGTGKFVWPTTGRTISGYPYSPEVNHPAIDIGGQVGNPVVAVDNGVVVYAGSSTLGYGNVIIIDHGNGWQSLYAHLNTVNVYCGQSVAKGAQIATLGSSGISSGPNLHFELRSDTLGKVNPLSYLPQ